MTTFLVEHYLPGSTAAERAADVERIHDAHRALASHGAEHMTSMIVDTDEMCMHVYSAATEAAVLAAHAKAGIPCDRVVQVAMRMAAGALKEFPS